MRSFEGRIIRTRLMALGLILASIAAALISMGLGAAGLSPEKVIGAIITFFTGGDTGSTACTIVLKVRMPRVLTSYVVGAALSVCGACMQGLFRNPMADPHLLGVSSGAALGVAVSAMVGAGALRNLSGLFAFVFAIATVILVLALSKVRGRVSTLSLVLAGIAVSALLNACTSGLMIINRDKLEDVYMWTMGSFTSSNWIKFAKSAPAMAIGSLGIMAFARDLNAMLMGEQDARQLGVQVRWVRVLLLALCTLVTAMAVSVSGVIGFVGLMVPHGMRLICGPDHRSLLPLSFLAGGLYLLLMDTLARTVMMPIEIPIGVLTALVGGPFFLYLMRRRNKG